MKVSEQLKARWKADWSNPDNYSLETAFLASLAYMDRPADIRKKLASDGTLTDKGIANALVAEIGKTVGQLKRDMALVARRRQTIEAKRADLGTMKFDKSDAAGAIRRMELRAYIKSLPHSEKIEVLLKNKEASLVEAVLELPGQVSGIDPKLHGDVRAQYVLDNHADTFDRLNAEEKMLGEVEAVQAVARNTIIDSCGFGYEYAGKSWFDGIAEAA